MQDQTKPRAPEQAEWLDELEAERVRIVERVASLDRAFSDLVDESRSSTPDDEHDPDGTTAYDRAQVQALRAASCRRLGQVEAALLSIDAEDFGVCERCHDAIGRERLEALPGVVLCVICAASGT